jgi:hypothetical protein
MEQTDWEQGAKENIILGSTKKNNGERSFINFILYPIPSRQGDHIKGNETGDTSTVRKKSLTLAVPRHCGGNVQTLSKNMVFTSAQSTVLAKVKNNTRQLIKHNRKIRRVNSYSIDRNSAQSFVFNWNTLVYGQKLAAVESFCCWRRQRLRSQSLVYFTVVESAVIVYVITAVESLGYPAYFEE